MRILALLLSSSLLALPAVAAPSDEPPIRTVSAASAPPIRTVSAASVPAPAPAPSAILPTLELKDIPDRCKDLAKRASVPSLVQALSARISLASCLADAKLATLELLDCSESVLAVDAAVAPSLELLDQVIAAGDASMQVLAQHAKAELFTNMAIRMQSTVPAAAGSTAEAYALRDSRIAIVETLIDPWRDQARDAHQAVVDLAKAHHELQRNPVVQTVVRESKARLAEAAAAAARTKPEPAPQTAAAAPATKAE
jgi:hypothetical protein